MPLLKRKRLAPVEPPRYDADKKESRNSLVWYSPLRKEIFKDYSEYLKRTTLYKKPIWQCETTGKMNLTYKEALESEKIEKERVQDKLPEQLQKRVLLRVQFQTSRLDAAVEGVYKYLMNRYAEGEVLNCIWDDNISYTAKVLAIADKDEISEAAANHDDETEEDKKEEALEYYKVQLIDENSDGIDDCIKIVPNYKLKRERFAFSKNLLKKFIKEYTVKDTYIGAPWIVRADTAERFGIDTTLPNGLQLARDLVYSKSKKRRNEAAAAAAAAAAAGKATDSPTATNGDVIIKDKKPVIVDARKVENTLKYPMEDLNIPAYRRDSSGFGPIVDMSPGTEGHDTNALNPTANMPVRPQPNRQRTTVPEDCYGSFLMVWSFLGVFSQPLKLSPFGLDDFENALHHNSHTTILTESNIALLNAIIKQRDRLKKESLGHGSMAMQAAISLFGSGYQACRSTPATNQQQQPHPFRQEPSSQYNSDDDMVDEQHIWRVRPPVQNRIAVAERGCGSPEVEAISVNWDNGTVDTDDEREGWEDILIGFINQLAPLEMLSDVDRLLAKLVPHEASTLEERERAYIDLSLRDKIKIFELLLSVANESHVIKTYMDECQDQMTELRKQKIDLSRERKRIHAERREMDEKQNEENNQNPDAAQESDSDSDDDSNASDNEDGALLKAQRKAEQLSRHESRQAVMKRRQAEREEREAKRLKLHHLQREEARVRNQEQKLRNEARKRLDEDERVMHKKEEQVERDMRKYSNHRIKPLGRDKFYNRYYYLDDIGGTLLHGSGKLFVQCPSDTDLINLQERDHIESLDTSVTQPCGRGGGVKFVCQLLKEQGMSKEAEYMQKRLEYLNRKDKDESSVESVNEWWHSYDDPEDLQKLLNWLNPKGIREFRLKRELEKQFHNITSGMKKRISDQLASDKHETTRRNTRSKAAPQFPSGFWLAYTNKLA